MNRFVSQNAPNSKKTTARYQTQPRGNSSNNNPPPFRTLTPHVHAGFTPTVNLLHLANQPPISPNQEYPPKTPEQLAKENYEKHAQAVASVHKQRAKAPGHLPQPPDTKSPCWATRCLNCHSDGHQFPECLLPLHCTECDKLGHIYNICPAVVAPNHSVDPLIPPANTSPERFPRNRIHNAQVHFKSTDSIEADLTRYLRCIVLDATLVEYHDRNSVLALLNRARTWENALQIAIWGSDRYVVSLPREVDTDTFANNPPTSITTLGYIIYPWSFKEEAFNKPYRYKVWLDFHHLPTFSWRTDQIRTLVSTFGILDKHGPLTFLASIEGLRVVASVADLNDVPNSIFLYCKNFCTPISIDYVGWKEEPFTISLEKSFVPPPSVYEEARLRLAALRAQKARPAWQTSPATPLSPIGGDQTTIDEQTLQGLLAADNKEEAIKSLLLAMKKGKTPLQESSSQGMGEDDNLFENELDALMDEDTNMGTTSDPNAHKA